MRDTKHTPAPWSFDSESGRIVDPTDSAVAFISGARTEKLENGRLIAAAPAMADLLLRAITHVTHGPKKEEVEQVLREAGIL